MMNNYLCSRVLACPARLYPICLRSEALRASFCSARRMRGRLTGQSRLLSYCLGGKQHQISDGDNYIKFSFTNII